MISELPRLLTEEQKQLALAANRRALEIGGKDWRKYEPDFSTPEPRRKAKKKGKNVGPRKRKRTPEFKAMIAALANKRRAAKLNATPAWADHRAIKALYLEAGRLGMHVDHIIPLQGKTVCGLHVEHNLQLLTPLENIRKRNRVLDP